MLILTRKKNEEIYIGNDCVVRVQRIVGSTTVRLAITAPTTTTILRGELRERPRKDEPDGR